MLQHLAKETANKRDAEIPPRVSQRPIEGDTSGDSVGKGGEGQRITSFILAGTPTTFLLGALLFFRTVASRVKFTVAAYRSTRMLLSSSLGGTGGDSVT